ncbi:hypothetical protein CPAV1605_1060 [seawater metagenome]|uniref:Uncharacterized protein n=1 Tax=seawater metagenome TaxID=1561972 RepID=A0A5E8CKS0_9ZZZZ
MIHLLHNDILSFLFMFLDEKSCIMLSQLKIFLKKESIFKCLIKRNYPIFAISQDFYENFRLIYNSILSCSLKNEFGNNIYNLFDNTSFGWNLTSKMEWYQSKTTPYLHFHFSKTIYFPGIYNLYLRLKIDINSILKPLFFRRKISKDYNIIHNNQSDQYLEKFNNDHVLFLDSPNQEMMRGKEWVYLYICQIETLKIKTIVDLFVQETSFLSRGYCFKNMLFLNDKIQLLN